MNTFTLYQLDRIYKIYKISKNILMFSETLFLLTWMNLLDSRKEKNIYLMECSGPEMDFLRFYCTLSHEKHLHNINITRHIWRKHISGISFALLLAHEIPCWIQRSNGVEGPSDFLKQNMFTICGEKTTGLQVFGVPSFAAMEIQRSNEGEGTCRTVFFHNLGGTIQVGNPRGLKCSRSWGLKSKVFPAL